MQLVRLLGAGVCVFLLGGVAMSAAPTGEPVPAVLTADAATVGLWTFAEGQGERVACATQAPAATLHGAVWVPGREGYAVATRSGYVSIPDDPALRPAGAITVEVWVKLAQAGGDLICKNGSYMLRLGSSMQAYFELDGRWRILRGQRPVPTGRWCHLAMTYDSATRTAALYVDGELDTRRELAGLTTGQLAQGTEELRLGTNTWSPEGNLVQGKIAALRISNVARVFSADTSAGRAAPPPGNLVPNGDFELGLLGWRLGGEGDATLSWAPDTDRPASGKRCLRSLPDSGGGDTLLSRPLPAHPGARYVLSARLRGKPGERAALAAYGVGAPGRGPSFEQSAELTSDWQEVRKEFTLPEDWGAPSLCVRLERPRSGAFWVDDVRLIAADPRRGSTLGDKLGVTPVALPVGHLFFAGRPAALKLEVVNSDTQAHRVSVLARVLDWEGRELSATDVGTFELAAGTRQQASLSLDTSRRGSFRLVFDLTAEGALHRQAADVKYAVVVPLQGRGNAETSAFGMNTHMEREPTPHLARNLQVLSQCGVKWIRGWWGWGMSEKERGKFDWTEYDRQLSTVEGAQMRLLPILLRYYPQWEQAWAGKTDEIQRPPYKMEEWSAFVRQVATRYRGRVSAWEVWNEPGMSGPEWTPELYASLLRATAGPIQEVDPKATLVGFAGVDLPYMRNVLAQGAAPTMDVVSEHSYSQCEQPEAHLPPRTAEVRSILTANGGVKPIWHTEQGVGGDDDGYLPPSHPEAEAAALYTRNLVVTRSLGVDKYFWFSAQTTPTYGWAVFYEDYIPRPRLVALNACASFLEGTAFRKAFRPSRNSYAFLFQGEDAVAVVWNLDAPGELHVPLAAEYLEAFDLMGNPLPVEAEGTEGERACLRLPADRPTYLRVRGRKQSLLEGALARAEMREQAPVTALVRGASDASLELTVTNVSTHAQDGVVDLLPSAADPQGKPALRRFHSLLPGRSTVLSIGLPARTPLRVRVGDWETREVPVEVAGG